MSELQTIKLSHLVESKTNPRQSYDKTALAELAMSIKQQGILEPLIARKAPTNGNFEIVVGSRRLRAARIAELDEVPVLVKELNDDQVIEIQLVENEQRADVHALEQATSYDRMSKAGHPVEEIAERIGKTAWHVRSRLQYMKLIEPAKKAFLADKIGAVNALQIARLQPDQQKEVLTWFRDEDFGPSDLAHQIQRHFFLLLSKAPFDIKDEKLVPKAGSCMNCPKRTGSDKLLFSDVKDKDTCTDPKCFEEKTIAFVKIAVGTHPDAVLLSVGHTYSGDGRKSKGLTGWVKAGGKNCKDTKQGVVVELFSNYNPQDVKLGQVLAVCVDLKCKTHHPAVAHSTGYSMSDSDKLRERKRRLELRRRGLVFKELAAEKYVLQDADYRAVLDWAIENLDHDHARAIGQAMEWTPVIKYENKDWRETVKKNLAKLSNDAVRQWTFQIMLGGTELWFYNHSTVSKPAILERKAREAGVPLAALAKLAAEKPAKKVAKTKANEQSKPAKTR